MCSVQMSYKDLRAKHEPQVANLYGFSSAKKMASVLVRTDNGFRLYNKVPHCLVPALRLLPPTCWSVWPCIVDRMRDICSASLGCRVLRRSC